MTAAPRTDPTPGSGWTHYDRWWIAYCVLGAALVVRAPTFLFALVVILVWAVLLTVLDLRSNITELWAKRAKRNDVSRDNTQEFLGMAESLADPKTERLAVFPDTASPSESVTAVIPKYHNGVIHSENADASVTDSGRVIINLHGTVWTDEQFLTELYQVVQAARKRGDRFS